MLINSLDEKILAIAARVCAIYTAQLSASEVEMQFYTHQECSNRRVLPVSAMTVDYT